MRRVEDDDARARRERSARRLPVDVVVGRTQRDEHRCTAAQLNRGHVGVVRRLEQQHVIAGMDERRQAGEERFGGA